MSKPVRFTRHALKKFHDLAEIGFVVTREQVVDVVVNPDSVDTDTYPPIAQKAVSTKHLLRVVFVEREDEIQVITFYPGERSRYEP